MPNCQQHISAAEIRREMLELLEDRGPAKTACPSEVARAVTDEGWRDLMPKVRQVTKELSKEEKVEVTKGGEPVSIEEASGPVRLGLPGGGE